jgi:hypothetical protein
VIRLPRPAGTGDMARVSIARHPLTATAALVRNGDLPRPLQQIPVRYRRRRDPATGLLTGRGSPAGAARPGQQYAAQPGRIPPQGTAAPSRPISLPYLR